MIKNYGISNIEMLKPLDSSEDSNGVYGSELMTNGGFEVLGTPIWENWLQFLGDGTIVDETEDIQEGLHAAKIIAGGSTNSFINSVNIAVEPGQIYFLDFYTHGDGLNVPMFHVYDVTHASFLIQNGFIADYSTSYFHHIREITIPDGCFAIQIFLRCSNAVGGITYFDNVRFYKVTRSAYFKDQFNRALETINTMAVSPTGHIYEGFGTLGKLQLGSGLMDVVSPAASGAAYLLIDMPSIPTYMTAKIKWKNNGSEFGDSAVMACSANRDELKQFQSMLHFYITSMSWNFDVVDSDGNFTSLGGAAFDTPLNVGTEYNFSMAINGNTVKLTIPGFAPQIITDVRIGALKGKYLFYEIYKANANRKTVQFLNIEAR